MGNSCTLTQESSNEESTEILNDESYQTRAVKIPVFTRKLGLNFKLDEGIQKIRPNHDNESVQDISTEKNLQDSNGLQFYINQLDSFLVQYKQNDDACKGFRKQRHSGDFLQEICSNEVVSQKVLISKKEDEYEDYYDYIRENDWDQYKFQTIFIMKMVDKHQLSQYNK